MPELPDVENFRRYLLSTSMRKRIEDVEVMDSGMLKNVKAGEFRDRLLNHAFVAGRRHGKYLFAELDDHDYLVMHFGMTGFLEYREDPGRMDDHVRIIIGFSNGYHLGYNCQRKLGMVTVIDDIGRFVGRAGLGPDAMDSSIGFDDFREMFSSRNGTIKSALMNQSILSGIGNVYSDEIMFQAGVHPRSSPKNIDEKTMRKLFNTMRRVLRVCIRNKADPENMPRTYLTKYRGEGNNCPKCGGGITKETVSGRSSYFCGKHQHRF